MRKILYVLTVSSILALLTVVLLSCLKGEITILGLFPGYWLSWATEQLIIGIFDAPYFTLDNISDFFGLEKFGLFGRIILLTSENLSHIFNTIFYSIIYFVSLIFFKSFTKQSLK